MGLQEMMTLCEKMEAISLRRADAKSGLVLATELRRMRGQLQRKMAASQTQQTLTSLWGA
jgi:hypothetical protein